MKKPKQRRKNPAFSKIPKKWTGPTGDVDIDGITESVSRIVGDLAISNAVAGCTANEKLLISALIPSFIGLIRTKGLSLPSQPATSGNDPSKGTVSEDNESPT